MAVRPKVFISYSWSAKQTVVDLANKLVGDGVEVTVDFWKLEIGHDVYAFMEQCVTNPDITKVLIICDKGYKEKADSRGNNPSGVGDETTILSAELYGKAFQTKYLPVIIERDETGNPYLPAFLKTRLFVDLTPDNYDEEYKKLLRTLYEVEPKPPAPGNIPEDIKNLILKTEPETTPEPEPTLEPEPTPEPETTSEPEPTPEPEPTTEPIPRKTNWGKVSAIATIISVIVAIIIGFQSCGDSYRTFPIQDDNDTQDNNSEVSEYEEPETSDEMSYTGEWEIDEPDKDPIGTKLELSDGYQVFSYDKLSMQISDDWTSFTYDETLSFDFPYKIEYKKDGYASVKVTDNIAFQVVDDCIVYSWNHDGYYWDVKVDDSVSEQGWLIHLNMYKEGEVPPPDEGWILYESDVYTINGREFGFYRARHNVDLPFVEGTYNLMFDTWDNGTRYIFYFYVAPYTDEFMTQIKNMLSTVNFENSKSDPTNTKNENSNVPLSSTQTDINVSLDEYQLLVVNDVSLQIPNDWKYLMIDDVKNPNFPYKIRILEDDDGYKIDVGNGTEFYVNSDELIACIWNESGLYCLFTVEALPEDEWEYILNRGKEGIIPINNAAVNDINVYELDNRDFLYFSYRPNVISSGEKYNHNISFWYQGNMYDLIFDRVTYSSDFIEQLLEIMMSIEFI